MIKTMVQILETHRNRNGSDRESGMALVVSGSRGVCSSRYESKDLREVEDKLRTVYMKSYPISWSFEEGIFI